MASLKHLVVGGLVLASWCGNAQSIQLKRAQKFTVETSAGRSVTKLRGNVLLSGSDGVFSCDSANWFRNENRFFAYSNVKFTSRDGLVVRARNLEYLNGESYFSGGVIVTDGDQKLTTSSLRYRTSDRRGSFSQRAEINTKDGSLTCRRGEFQGSDYRFLGDVRWNGANERIRGEAMHYDTRARSASFPSGGVGTFDRDSLAFGRGEMALGASRRFSASDSVEGWGPSRHFTSKEFRRWPDEDRTEWFGSAHITDWSGDSTELWADRIFTTSDSIQASGSAQVRMPSWSGRAERWRGHRKDSLFVLDVRPVIWSQEYQIIAHEFQLDQRGPADSLWALGGVHLGEVADSAGRCNQMAAETMQARIASGQMQRMHLETNAQALFYPQSGPASRMKSAHIELMFKPEGGLDVMTFYPQPNGSSVNESEPSYLPGYSDRWGERPSRTAATSGRK